MTELHVRPNTVPPAILGGYTGRDIRAIESAEPTVYESAIACVRLIGDV